MITGRELLAWLQAHPTLLDDPVHLLAQDDAPSYLTTIEQDCFDEAEGPVISLVSEHEKASEEPAKQFCSVVERSKPETGPVAPSEEPAGETKPRVWNAGDPMPDDVFKVRDSMGDVWERNAISDVDLWFAPDTIPMTWERIARKYAPLTEVERQADSEAQLFRTIREEPQR